MGGRLEYRLSCYESDLRSSIADGFPDLDMSKIDDYVNQAMGQIKKEGNGALRWGLILYGREMVKKRIEES